MMGTEAQQALQKRTRAISPGGGARNVEGTRYAQQQALRKNAQPGHVARRKPQQQHQRGDQYGREIGDGQVGAGYGGMGHGPLEKDSAMKRAQTRANPRDMARQVLSKIAEPSVNYRPEGSIWDDPKYAAIAHERGDEFAMKARNLDRQYNQAKQWQQSRVEGMQNQLAMDEGKLRDQQLQHAMRHYAPQNIQGTGVDPATGLATDDSGAFTGDIKQTEAVGPGPQAQPEPEAQMTTQDKVKLVEAYSRMLTDIDTPEETKAMIRQALPQLMPQMGSAAQPGGQPQSAQEVKQIILDKNPGADPNSEEFQTIYRNALKRFGLSE